MSESIDEYITRISKILTENKPNKTNINNGTQRHVDVAGKIKNKKKSKVARSFNYKTVEQFESLLKRAVILHTEGVYVRPPDEHNCKKKKRKNSGIKTDRGPDAKMPKTTFGSGRVGVSCESYGVKSCTCCAPRNNEDKLFMQAVHEIEETSFLDDLLFKHPNKKIHVPSSDFIDLTNTSGVGGASTSKTLNNSVINISDSSPDNSLIMIPNEVIILDDDNSPKKSKIDVITKTENIVIKTENINLGVKNFANVDDITEYINLVTDDYDEDEMKKNEEDLEETINSQIKTEIIDTFKPNFAGVENITDYINLVTTDYDEDAMRKYEDELAETIHATDFELLSDSPENKTKNVLNEDVPQIISNTEKLPKTDINRFKEKIQIIESPPVASKPITSNCSPPGLICPICLEKLTNREIMSTICGHLFCAECIKEVIKKTKSCPNCRKKLSLKSIHPIYLG